MLFGAAASTRAGGSEHAGKTAEFAPRGGPGADIVPGHKSFRKWNASSAFFFTVADELWICGLRLFANLRLGFLSPIGENFLA